MKIGLFFGSFNPIHIGHIIIANHLIENSSLEKIWFVVTPHNPFKDKKTLAANHHRLEMAEIALKDYENLQECDIEFSLPQPNYTIDTLIYLEERYKNHQFSLIMGEDNLKNLHKWKNYEIILKKYPIFVYPRLSKDENAPDFVKNHENIHFTNAPIIEISSTFIREQIKNKKNIIPLISKEVFHYIDSLNLYV